MEIEYEDLVLNLRGYTVDIKHPDIAFIPH